MGVSQDLPSPPPPAQHQHLLLTITCISLYAPFKDGEKLNDLILESLVAGETVSVQLLTATKFVKLKGMSSYSDNFFIVLEGGAVSFHGAKAAAAAAEFVRLNKAWMSVVVYVKWVGYSTSGHISHTDLALPAVQRVLSKV